MGEEVCRPLAKTAQQNSGGRRRVPSLVLRPSGLQERHEGLSGVLFRNARQSVPLGTALGYGDGVSGQRATTG